MLDALEYNFFDNKKILVQQKKFARKKMSISSEMSISDALLRFNSCIPAVNVNSITVSDIPYQMHCPKQTQFYMDEQKIDVLHLVFEINIMKVKLQQLLPFEPQEEYCGDFTCSAIRFHLHLYLPTDLMQLIYLYLEDNITHVKECRLLYPSKKNLI
jgi:hypothetical protein